MPINSDSFAQLFINDTPMLDVRAPVEFQRGAFPTAANLPLLDDLQRESVGKCYKLEGQSKAIEKGHELVNGDIRNARITAWAEFIENNPTAALYCFRGGLRSEITQQWLQEAGVELPKIEGGYKALRTFLINVLDTTALEHTYHLVGGKTGCAKTSLINELDNAIDLEAAAYHRGSSFGRHAREQNNQINFENIVAIDLLKLNHRSISSVVLEDEARGIGKVRIPETLFTTMRASPIVVIEMPFDVRLERLVQEYVVDMQTEFVSENSVAAFDAFSNYLLRGLENIKKRLGSAHFETAHKAMQKALAQHLETGDVSHHYDWLSCLLKNYYDPLYEYGLSRRKEFICFRGSYQACEDYLRTASPAKTR